MNEVIEETTLTLTWDYYGNESYGKRVYWISENGKTAKHYIWPEDLDGYVKDMREKGYKIVIIK